MNHSFNNQRGVVLVVSLIFLLLITVIALSTVSSSTFQTTMMNNAQQNESVFRVAESAAEQALTKNILSKAYDLYLKNGDKPTKYDVPSTSLNTTQQEVELAAVVLHVGAGPIPTFQSIEAGRQWRNMVYESRGNANTTDDKVQTQVIQGVGKLNYMGAASAAYEPY